MKLITTSWDDGNIADLRLAELLDKYNLAGTFYIPAANKEHSVMSEKDIVELSGGFEIGGHTINHVKVDKTSFRLFDAEIKGCYEWLTNLLGQPPISFCFPVGAYNKSAIDYTLSTGFKIIRTTELLNPWLDAYDPIVPTTLQVYPHSAFTYYKHLIKRLKYKSLKLYIKSNNTSDLIQLVDFYLNNPDLEEGCFHLWGHSWEIEENNLWSKLEEIFKILSNISGVSYVNNGDLRNFKKHKS